MSTCFILFFWGGWGGVRFQSKNKHWAHRPRCGNSLKLRFGSKENRFPEFGSAQSPTPEISNLGRPLGPAHPSRGPHLPRPGRERPLPPCPRPEPQSHPRVPRPRRPHSALAPGRGRAACGQGRGRAGTDRGGVRPGPSARARPRTLAAARPEPHLPTPYFSSSVGVHMAGPGAAPRARRPGDSAAGTAAGPAVAHREPRRGRSGGAGQWAAHPSQAARDAAAATSGPRGSAGGPGVPGGAGEGSPPVRRRRSRAAARLLTAPPLGSRRRRGSARLSGLAGRPRMRHSPARGGSRRPGSRRPNPRASSRAAAARRRREIRETRLVRPAQLRADSSADPAPGRPERRRGDGPARLPRPVPPARHAEIAAGPVARGAQPRRERTKPFSDPSSCHPRPSHGRIRRKVRGATRCLVGTRGVGSPPENQLGHTRVPALGSLGRLLRGSR